MPTKTENKDILAQNKIIEALNSIDASDRERILQSAITFLGIEFPTVGKRGVMGAVYKKSSPVSDSVGIDYGQEHTVVSFSEDRSMSPKEFLHLKDPQTDVERVACLAYYLSHYRDQPHFKTIDVSKLNTEAAQRKFANPAVALKNAITSGFLVPSTKGMRQLSAQGEQYVLALPDRTSAKEKMASRKNRKKRPKKS